MWWQTCSICPFQVEPTTSYLSLDCIIRLSGSFLTRHTTCFSAHSLLSICSLIHSSKGEKKTDQIPTLIAHFVPGTKDAKNEQHSTIFFQTRFNSAVKEQHRLSTIYKTLWQVSRPKHKQSVLITKKRKYQTLPGDKGWRWWGRPVSREEQLVQRERNGREVIF